MNNKFDHNKRIKAMHRYLYLLTLLMLFVIGCSEESSVLSPDSTISTNEPNWIALPAPEGMQINSSFTESKWINGRYGGTISLYRSYYNRYGNVIIDADITFPNYSFSGSKTISMTCDDQNCVTSFSPSMVFNKNANFTVIYSGVDLSDINPSNIKFAYIASDGSVQYAQHEGITINKYSGYLKVKNAKIPHFSRYGFVN